MRVFVNTPPLYALLDARDQAHGQALGIFRRAADEDHILLCPLPTALELHSLILRRKSNDPGAAHRIAEKVLEAYPLVFPTESDAAAARELLGRYSDRSITLADALVFCMAKRERAKVLTFAASRFSMLGADLYLI